MSSTTKPTPQIITPIAYDKNYVYVKCPFCGDIHRHWHRWAKPGGEVVGLRISTCKDGNPRLNLERGGYVIAPIPLTCPKGKPSLFT